MINSFINEKTLKRVIAPESNLGPYLDSLLINGFYGISCHQNMIVVYRTSNGLQVICANFDKYNDHKMRDYFKDIETTNKTLQSCKNLVESKIKEKNDK